MYSFFKKKALSPDTCKNQVSGYYTIKNKLELPLKIKLFLQMLENSVEEKNEKKKIPKQITDIYKHFCKSFSKLSRQEKLYFLLAIIKIVELILKDENALQVKSFFEYECKIDKIETSCQVRQFFMGVSVWQDRVFKFFNVQKIIKICSHNYVKKQVIFQLNQYHLRVSSKQKNTIVLQAIFDTWKLSQKQQSFYIHFKDRSLFNEVYNILRNAIIMTWKQRLVSMLNYTDNKKIENMTASQNTGSVGVRMLTSKTISDFFKTKQVVKKLMIKNIKWKQFSQIRKIKIFRSKHFQNLYKTENIIQHSFDNVVKNIELVNRVPTKKLLHYQKMENFSNTISGVYYKYMVKGCTHQMLCIVEELSKENQCKVTYKAIDNFVVEKNVDFVEIKVQRLGGGKTKISALGFINFDQNKKLNPVSVVDFFLSIVEYQLDEQSTVLRSTFKYDSTFQAESTKVHEQCQQEIQNDEDEFHTVVGDNFDSDDQRELQICNTFQSPKKHHAAQLDDQIDDNETEHQRNVIEEFRFQKPEEDITRKMSSCHIFDPKLINETDYLKKRTIMAPSSPKDKKQLLKQHYFLGEWANYEKGGVYSLNTKQIDKQKKIYQSFLTRLGKALMSKKLSNISIPVIILREESMLQSIARNMSYAPLLLEKMEKMSSIDKMKNAIVFMISMGTIGLSLDKPFNPILGETFQAFIDKCPVYMEQTCHHPPISTLYFQGRGYEIYGSVNPGISLRLNSVKCFSETPFFVKFNNGDLIEFRPGKMQIGGLLVGDRTFDYCDTTYLCDEKNKLIAEITFGPKKKFGKYLRGDKTDFLWGYIYMVSDNFMTRFVKQGKNLSPSAQKCSQIVAQVYGCWHQKIYIDQNVVYDFQTQLPCTMNYEKYTLRSDSQLRMDISYLSEEKFSQAQDQKDRLQQIQRYEAKIRKGPK